jgi:type II secretory pathway component PulC
MHCIMHPYILHFIMQSRDLDAGRDAAGLRAGDVLLSFNDTEIVTGQQMQDLARISSGQVIPAVIWRNGTQHSVSLRF